MEEIFIIFRLKPAALHRVNEKNDTLPTTRKKPKKQSLDNDLCCFPFITKQNEYFIVRL